MATILLAEDEPACRAVMRIHLGLQGHEVEAVADAEAALRAVRLRHVDLCLLDLMLPGVDGFELCRRLRAEPACVGVPMIALTALEAAQHGSKAAASGFDGYIEKPFVVGELHRQLDTFLADSAAG